MASQIFQNMLAAAKMQGQTVQHGKANQWFRDKALSLKKVQTANIVKDATDRHKNVMMPGNLYLFYYDPKHKDTLPYYDLWPIIFPLEIKKDRILGMNFHYLQPVLRAQLLDALWEYTSNTKMDETTKMKATYGILKNASRFNLVKPTLHWYLKDHIRSRFVKIYPQEWEFAMMLPADKFVKENRTTVWRDSRKKAGISK